MKNILIVLLLTLSAASFTRAQKSESNISVKEINKAGLQKLISVRNGKVLFINLWATWCVPCREEFPSIVKLAGEYKTKGIDFYGISIDFPEEADSKIIPFLKSQKINFTSFVNGFRYDEDLINLLDKKWSGALPATFIFDSEGNKLFFLEGKQSYEAFKKALEAALKK